MSRGGRLRDTALVAALREVFAAAPRAALGVLCCRILQALTPLALVALSSELLAGILSAVAAPAGTSERDLARADVELTGGLLVLLLLVDALLRMLRQFAQDRLRQRVTLRIEERLQAHAATLDLAHFEAREFHDLLHRVQLDAAERPVRAFDALVGGLQAALTFTGATILVAVTAPWFLAAALPLALVAVWLRQRTAQAMLREIERRTPEERFMRYLSALLTGPQHAKEVRVHGFAAALRQRWRALAETVTDARLRLQRGAALRAFLLHAVSGAAMAAALWWLVLETIAGSLSFATLVLDAQALQRMFMALTALVGSLSQLVEHQLWLRRLAEFFALRQAISAPEHAEPAPRRILQGIAVRGVRFRHNGATRDALQDVSCTFKPGEITGIAGVNGAGKSTLIRLLARLSDPDAGAVLVDGVDLRAMAPEAWRQRIGVIFQDFGRYELAVHETVALATGGNAARVDVERALAAATATPVVERIPGGSDGIPGPRFGGGELSLGEWQRLALARALLPDAAVLLLDEPTAALDGAAEEALFAELRRRAPGRVILVVAHRPSALALCNRVIRLHDGRIVADGGPGAQRA